LAVVECEWAYSTNFALTFQDLGCSGYRASGRETVWYTYVLEGEVGVKVGEEILHARPDESSALYLGS
jgi:hypothetical protein